MKKHVFAVVGPTASGKTALSLPLAKALGAQILCMDSMQVYTHMDIGTAKPTAEEKAQVPHHLIDIASPFDAFTVTDYVNAATPLLDSLPTPMLVGGTGLYLQAVSTSASFGEVSADEELRAKLHQLADEKGVQHLHDQLEKVDPVSAQKFHPNDVRRVIRALEVFTLTGKPISAQQDGTENSPYRFSLFALSHPRDVLYDRVNRRVDVMMEEGLLDEVIRLRDMGVPYESTCMQGLGYKELYDHLSGRLSLPDAVSLIKLRTRHFAKRQLTWFKRDQRIHWLDAALPAPVLLEQALEIIHRNEVNV